MIQKFHYWCMSKMTENRDSDGYFFTARLFTIAKTWKQSKCPVRAKWIFKMWYIHTMEYYPVLKKRKEILTHATTWMNFKDIVLSGVSQLQKDLILYDSRYTKSSPNHRGRK